MYDLVWIIHNIWLSKPLAPNLKFPTHSTGFPGMCGEVWSGLDCACAIVWIGPSLSACRFACHYNIYRHTAKVLIRLFDFVGWSGYLLLTFSPKIQFLMTRLIYVLNDVQRKEKVIIPKAGNEGPGQPALLRRLPLACVTCLQNHWIQ